MKATEYFLKMIQTDHVFKLKWYYSVFALISKNATANEYLKIEEDSYYVLIEKEWIKIDDRLPVDGALLSMMEPIVLEKDSLENVHERLETTIGLTVMNVLYFTSIFGTMFNFQNKAMTPKSVENMVITAYKKDAITVEQYHSFMDVGTFLEGLARIITVSITPKTIVPPPGIKEYSIKVREEMVAKYGTNWVKDRSRIVEYEEALKKYDKAWLKDDPSLGKLMSGKILNDARVKMNLGFGAESAFDETGTDVNLITNSLLDGYPKDAASLAVIFNTSRAGSFFRGHETQKGGASAKDLLRATAGIVIVPGDCNTRLGHPVTVGKWMGDNLTGRYIIEGDKVSKIENMFDYIGKTIVIRSPQYCNQANGICSICSGEVMAKYPNGVSILATDISGAMLNSSLKKMHASKSTTMKFNIKETIR